MTHSITIPSGTTLSDIAEKEGTTISEIMKLNPVITNPNNIKAGNKLILPSTSNESNNKHTIVKGENLTSIAQKYGTNIENLMKANSSISDPNKIQVGQVLNIPITSTPSEGATSMNYDQTTSITENKLKAIMPHCSHPEYLNHINTALKEGQINTTTRQAAFLAQLAHESGELVYMEEIASGEAYEGRKDLGNTQPGDGKRFKGRGPIQLTGRSNYRMAGKALGLDLETHPESVATPEVGFRTSVWFWTTHGLNALADKNTLESFDKISKTINGGTTGQAERRAYWNKAKTVLNSK